MRSSTTRAERLAARDERPSLADRLARDGVLCALEPLAEGELTIVEPGGRHVFGRRSADGPLAARIRVDEPRFWSDVALGGALGAAESYVRGAWESDDLVAVVRILARNRASLESIERGAARLKLPFLRLLHGLRRNSRAGSRRNIERHYDLGNDFFSLFLDPEMTYSSAIYPRADAGLDEAAVHKLDVVCRKLGLDPSHELLEIGGGWGGLAIHAATRHGCRVTTTTISREQHAFAVERVRRAGLADRVTVLLEDYRDLPRRLARRFDRIVSVEMIEAVGRGYLETFFHTCAELLSPGGRMLLQAIVIRDQDEARYRRRVDFIQRYIFPGGYLPSVSGLMRAIARATPLRVAALEDLTPHYARTLRDWRERFERSAGRLRALGHDEAFQRLWRWYFCYCEGGFRERTAGLVHLELAGPAAERA